MLSRRAQRARAGASTATTPASPAATPRAATTATTATAVVSAAPATVPTAATCAAAPTQAGPPRYSSGWGKRREVKAQQHQSAAGTPGAKTEAAHRGEAPAPRPALRAPRIVFKLFLRVNFCPS